MGDLNVLVSAVGMGAADKIDAVPAPPKVSLCNANFRRVGLGDAIPMERSGSGTR